MGKHKILQKILESYYIICRFMFSGRMFHRAVEEVCNKRISYSIVQFLLCTSVVVEADLNGLDSSGLIPVQ